METFTLVVSSWLLGGLLWTVHETRTAGLSEIECRLRAAEIQRPREAKCVREPEELFTLNVWLYRGERFEDTQVLGLTRNQCSMLHFAILADRGKVRAQCVGANGPVGPGEVKPFPPCADGACGGPLPGRRRV